MVVSPRLPIQILIQGSWKSDRMALKLLYLACLLIFFKLATKPYWTLSLLFNVFSFAIFFLIWSVGNHSAWWHKLGVFIFFYLLQLLLYCEQVAELYSVLARLNTLTGKKMEQLWTATGRTSFANNWKLKSFLLYRLYFRKGGWAIYFKQPISATRLNRNWNGGRNDNCPSSLPLCSQRWTLFQNKQFYILGRNDLQKNFKTETVFSICRYSVSGF